MRIPWFAVVALVALLYVILSGLANPRTRPFVIGLGTLVGLGAVFFGYVATGKFQEEKRMEEAQVQAQAKRHAAWADAEARRADVPHRVMPPKLPPPPVPSPPKNPTASETKQPKMTLLTALGQAFLQVWADPAKPQPPDWVNAAPKMEDGCYTTSVQVGPFTTPLECERELPKALQGAVSEYAELSLEGEAAGVRLPDDVLQQLVRERWTEIRPMQIGDTSQEMVSLHALVVFDAPVQQRIKAEAQRLVIGRRVHGAAVVFGGVLGLLALSWGGLRWAARRQEVRKTQTP